MINPSNTDTDISLSHDEIKQFELDGFLGPFDLPEEALADLGADFPQRVAECLRTSFEAGVVRNQHLYSKSLVGLVTHEEILERVKSLLGPDLLLWVSHVIALESNADGRLWHSDMINQHVRGIHLSIALTDMTIKNGCLRLVAGSHLYRANLASFDIIPGDDDPSDFADQVAPWNAPHSVVEMEVKAGQFFFTWGGLWHGVGTNHTETPRCSIVARFARTDVTCRDYGIPGLKISDVKKLPCLLVSGQDDFGLNLIHEPPTDDIFVNEKFMRTSPMKRVMRKLKIQNSDTNRS